MAKNNNYEFIYFQCSFTYDVEGKRHVGHVDQGQQLVERASEEYAEQKIKVKCLESSSVTL